MKYLIDITCKNINNFNQNYEFKNLSEKNLYSILLFNKNTNINILPIRIR